MFLSLPHLGAPSRDTQSPGVLVASPQLHLGRRQGGCLHVCKTWALFHTPLTSLGKGGGRAGHTGTVPFLAPLRMPQHTVSSRGTRDVISQHMAALAERSLWQWKHGPARAGSPCYSTAKESEQVTSAQSPPCLTSLAHRFFTAKIAPPAQS